MAAMPARPNIARCTVFSAAFQSGALPPCLTRGRRAKVACRGFGPTATGPHRVAMVSLGCPKNTVDGEVMLGSLQRAGCEVVQDAEAADTLIVNTCAFIEDAKVESLDAIMDAIRRKSRAAKAAKGRKKKVVVTGCLAQRYGSELAEEVPEVDLVMGFEKYSSLASAIMQDAPATAVQVGSPTYSPFPLEAVRHRLTPRHYAYLRVAEGCNHACTFCAIPSFRGKFRSKPAAEVLAEARVLVAAGALELNLVAEDTNQYGHEPGRRGGAGLAQLLADLASIPGLRWIRILYAYPSYFTDELVDEIARNPKVCKYIDIPLQHISNLTLLAMSRPPAVPTRKLLDRLRARIPDLALRTTFISGFPGENAAAHEELVQFSETFGFERGGAFAYSPEDGTPAAGYPAQVPDHLRAERRDELIAIQQRNSAAFAARLVGREIDVLVESYNEAGELVGRTQWDAPDVDGQALVLPPVDPTIPPAAPGQMRRCRVVGSVLLDVEVVPIR